MAEYFSHDFNSRNDPKMVSLFLKMGHEGHGIFWGLVELSYEQGGRLEMSQCETYAFALRTQCDKLKTVISDFNLFRNDGIFFWSETILKRLNLRYDKSQKASNSAKIRWNNANAMRTQCERNAKKESKEKESNTLCGFFSLFWNEYPKKVGKGDAEKAWKKIKEPKATLELILSALKWQKNSDQWKKEGGQYIPYPATYLNRKQWDDQPNNSNVYNPAKEWKPG